MTADLEMDPWHTTLIKRVVGVGAVYWFSAFIRWMIDGWVSQWFDKYLPRYKDTIRIHLTPAYERNTAYRHGSLKVNIKSVKNVARLQTWYRVIYVHCLHKIYYHENVTSFISIYDHVLSAIDSFLDELSTTCSIPHLLQNHLLAQCHYVNHCWHIAEWTLVTKYQWNIKRYHYFYRNNIFKIWQWHDGDYLFSH